MKLTLSAIAGLLAIMGTLFTMEWQPVLAVQFKSHVADFQSDRLDRICQDCLDRCWQWCPKKMLAEECSDFCPKEVCFKECR